MLEAKELTKNESFRPLEFAEKHRGAAKKKFYLPGVVARTLGSGCDVPPAKATRARPPSQAPKEALLLCAEGRGRSLGGGYLLHVLGLIVTITHILEGRDTPIHIHIHGCCGHCMVI